MDSRGRGRTLMERADMEISDAVHRFADDAGRSDSRGSDSRIKDLVGKVLSMPLELSYTNSSVQKDHRGYRIDKALGLLKKYEELLRKYEREPVHSSYQRAISLLEDEKNKLRG